MSFVSTDPSSHQSENTWFTPRDFIKAIGEFDTDPCTMSFRPFDIAKTNIERDRGGDGLSFNWANSGRMFINPPYGKEIAPFIDKFIEERPSGVMLIFARMGSESVQKLINAGAYCFLLRRRIYFISKSGEKGTNAGTDSMLVFWNRNELLEINLDGVLISKDENPVEQLEEREELIREAISFLTQTNGLEDFVVRVKVWLEKARALIGEEL